MQPAAASAQLLLDDFAQLDALAAASEASAEDLAANLRRMHQQLFAADLARYDAVAARSQAVQLMRQVFALRLRLRGRIAGWETRGFMTKEVQTALRDVFRVARYAEDMLGEIATGHDRLPPGGKTLRAFTGPDVNTLINPEYASQPFAFRSGDVILMRGQLHNSAAIARIGDVDTQFSHLAIIYVDADQKPWVVEALIEDGAVISTIDSVLDHGLGRCVLYRHKDTALAARAAEAIHAKVAKSLGRKGKRILYDFSMELEGTNELFCSKLVRDAFLQASGGTVSLPTYKTRFDARNTPFYDRIGMTAKETFAPGDIDLEPDFDLVAEWQDYRVTSNLRLQDMVQTKMFEWMEERGYTFREDFSIWLIGLLGRGSSYLSDKSKRLIAEVVPKVPSNMSRRTVATIAMLHKTAEPLYRAMQRLEADTIDATGRSLHPREILAALERIRETSRRQRVGYLVAPR